MDKKKASASGKQGEKKEENFLTKTAHSIRDKVQELTDEVKEKTHNLTHSSDSKHKKQDKDNKKTDAKWKKSPKLPTASKKDSSSDSDDEDDTPKAPPTSVSSSGQKRDNERGAGKSGASPSRPAAAAATEKKDAAPTTNSKFPSDKSPSRDSANKSSDDHKNTASTAAPSSSKPSGDNLTTRSRGAPSNNDPKASTDKSNKPTDGGDAKKKPSPEEINTGRIHISFEGVTTVYDLLDRIDDAIEKSDIVVENDKGPTGYNLRKTSGVATPHLADLDKKPVEKAEEDKKKEEQKKKEYEEPIRLNYKDLHNIEDILLKINKQPGHRKIILENAPGSSISVTVQKRTSTTAPSTSTISNENNDSSGPPKSILKISQDPSSLNTSTKRASFEDDQIHVNIEGIQSLDDLLDRLDDVVQHVPIVIDTKPHGEKRQAPQAPNQNDNNNQSTTTTSLSTQKREAPKPPSSLDDVSRPSHKQEDDKALIFKFPEREFASNNDNKQPTSPATSEKADWI